MKRIETKTCGLTETCLELLRQGKYLVLVRNNIIYGSLGSLDIQFAGLHIVSFWEVNLEF